MTLTLPELVPSTYVDAHGTVRELDAATRALVAEVVTGAGVPDAPLVCVPGEPSATLHGDLETLEGAPLGPVAGIAPDAGYYRLRTADGAVAHGHQRAGDASRSPSVAGAGPCSCTPPAPATRGASASSATWPASPARRATPVRARCSSRRCTPRHPARRSSRRRTRRRRASGCSCSTSRSRTSPAPRRSTWPTSPGPPARSTTAASSTATPSGSSSAPRSSASGTTTRQPPAGRARRLGRLRRGGPAPFRHLVRARRDVDPRTGAAGPSSTGRPAGAAGFAAEHADRVAFYCWAQWVGDGAVRVPARRRDGRRGRRGGFDSSSADAWVHQEIVCFDYEVGCPARPAQPRGSEVGPAGPQPDRGSSPPTSRRSSRWSGPRSPTPGRCASTT